jgi:hypothetical protein
MESRSRFSKIEQRRLRQSFSQPARNLLGVITLHGLLFPLWRELADYAAPIEALPQVS